MNIGVAFLLLRIDFWAFGDVPKNSSTTQKIPFFIGVCVKILTICIFPSKICYMGFPVKISSIYALIRVVRNANKKATQPFGCVVFLFYMHFSIKIKQNLTDYGKVHSPFICSIDFIYCLMYRRIADNSFGKYPRF